MTYEIKVRKHGTRKWEGYFAAESVERIVQLASHFGDEYELKISTVGHAIETLDHPHKGVLIQKVLATTNCMAPAECPFAFQVFGWAGNANEAIIRWTFDNLVGHFAIESISVSESGQEWGSSRRNYTINVKRK